MGTKKINGHKKIRMGSGKIGHFDIHHYHLKKEKKSLLYGF